MFMFDEIEGDSGQGFFKFIIGLIASITNNWRRG